MRNIAMQHLLNLMPMASGSDIPKPGPFASPSDRPEERLLGLDILIVEDETMLALDLAFAFEDAGAEVIGPSHTLDAAMALVSQPGFRADAAVLDVDLAGREVLPVAYKLLELGIPFLFHTGHGDRQHLTSLFPGALVCMKPTLSDELIAKLRKLTAVR